MSLKWKFNIILLATGLIGILISGVISFNLQRDNARQEALETAAILLESSIAVRTYTVEEVRPLIAANSSKEFLPQTVPAYAAAQYISYLQKQHPDYNYKEAALNPTNPANRATDWEADIIRYFRTSGAKVLIGERDTPTGRSLYLSKPIRITNGKCLICHSNPDAAPAALTKRYGRTNGFGWQLNEVIGTQVVSVPLSLAHDRANKEFLLFMGTIIAVFFSIGMMLNLLLNNFVIKPVEMMAAHVDKVSLGTLDLPPLQLRGNDEIASLGRSFNRMQNSLDSAVKMLDDTLDN
ncbi:MAG: DUF3365 domain-containing protein [Pseudomonadales bacterium]|nr:DUF3365 domain-containing protein [Pseudomonadales bacterium]NRA15005.1 DUF3365 domain-containing protein [Oceanospirillaceae bacterium]